MSRLKKGTVINDRFLLIECLGTGLFSQVWRAFDETLDSEVALKIYSPLTPDGTRELKREYRNTIGVSHQNLLTPQGMDVCRDGAYLVMKCCSKGSASALAGLADEPTVWRFIRDVSSGLAYLHGLSEPIIHQDMKLANIMIDDDDRFLISDFGICYKVTQIMVRQTGRGRNALMAYMSPERFSADYNVPLTSSDIWTLGALVYALCTGSAPFGDFGGAAQRNGQMLPVLPRGWSRELQMLVNACLQPNTWDRPKASKICEFASLMLRNQHPDISMLGIPVPAAETVSDYTGNNPDELLDKLDDEVAQDAEPALDFAHDTATGYGVDNHEHISALAESDVSQPEYLSIGAAPVADSEPGVPETSGAASDNTHFTSGTRYRGRADGRATRRSHRRRTPARKVADWMKKHSSLISLVLIMAASAGIYWYGLDNLLSLKFLPEKTNESALVEEKVIVVDNTDAVPVNTGKRESKDTINVEDAKIAYNLPTPPPAREHKGVTPIDEKKLGKTPDNNTPVAKSPADSKPGTVAPAPAADDTAHKPAQPDAGKTKTAPAPKPADTKKAPADALAASVQSGDYVTVKRMADAGSAAAAGEMAKKYLKENNHAAANEYAQMAKKGGDPAGDVVINKLKVQGFYE